MCVFFKKNGGKCAQKSSCHAAGACRRPQRGAPGGGGAGHPPPALRPSVPRPVSRPVPCPLLGAVRCHLPRPGRVQCTDGVRDLDVPPNHGSPPAKLGKPGRKCFPPRIGQKCMFAPPLSTHFLAIHFLRKSIFLCVRG